MRSGRFLADARAHRADVAALLDEAIAANDPRVTELARLLDQADDLVAYAQDEFDRLNPSATTPATAAGVR